MDAIKFETGLKTFDVNGAVEITFNPTSAAFLCKLQSTAEELNAVHERFAADAKNGDALTLLEKADVEMRKILDGVLGDGFCAAAVPPDNALLLDIGGGFPIWANIILAILGKMDDSLAAEKGVAEKRIRKYSAKYKK